MSGSQGNEQGFNLSRKDSFNIVYVLAKAHAMCFLPFLRKNFGSEALGWFGLCAFVFMLVVGSFARIPEMWPFLGLWMLFVVFHRVSTIRAVRRRVIRHSRYEGDVDTRLIKSPTIVKQVVEPLVCVFAGVCLEAYGTSHSFALFVGWGCLSLALVALIDRQLDNKRLAAMRDAAIEQQYLAARYRGEIE
jgi:hypothetical protein